MESFCGSVFCRLDFYTAEIVDKNGYRYYSYTQLETFSVLTMFKDLRVPLKEVKAHMDHRSPGLTNVMIT